MLVSLLHNDDVTWQVMAPLTAPSDMQSDAQPGSGIVKPSSCAKSYGYAALIVELEVQGVMSTEVSLKLLWTASRHGEGAGAPAKLMKLGIDSLVK